MSLFYFIQWNPFRFYNFLANSVAYLDTSILPQTKTTCLINKKNHNYFIKNLSIKR